MTTGDDATGYFSMRTMVPAAIVVWAVAFWFVYGPMVFAYLLLHAATTGVFLAAIRRADRSRMARHEMRTLAITPQPSRELPRQPAKRAVAS